MAPTGRWGGADIDAVDHMPIVAEQCDKGRGTGLGHVKCQMHEKGMATAMSS